MSLQHVSSIRHKSPRALAVRARLVAAHFEVGAVYLLPSGKLARYRGLSDDGLEFSQVDPHRAEDLQHAQFALSAANAAKATIAYTCAAWKERHQQHAERTRKQKGSSA